jgi:Domain of unknown function (DUF4328)
VVFILWFHRAYANLSRLGATAIEYGDGWAIGGWFVPLLNLLRPKEIADDIWRGSDPDQLDSPPDVSYGKVPAFLHVWWLLWITALVGYAVHSRMPVETLDHERAAGAVLAAVTAVGILAGILAIVVIRRLTARQELRARRLGDARCTPSVTAATTAR